MSDHQENFLGADFTQPNLINLLKDGGPHQPAQIDQLKALAEEHLKSMIDAHSDYLRNFPDTADLGSFTLPPPVPGFVEATTDLAKAKRYTFASMAFDLFFSQKSLEAHRKIDEAYQSKVASLEAENKQLITGTHPTQQAKHRLN